MLALPIVESPLCAADCLIAACAIRNGLAVLHHDGDFGFLARVSSLSARDIRR